MSLVTEAFSYYRWKYPPNGGTSLLISPYYTLDWLSAGTSFRSNPFHPLFSQTARACRPEEIKTTYCCRVWMCSFLWSPCDRPSTCSLQLYFTVWCIVSFLLSFIFYSSILLSFFSHLNVFCPLLFFQLHLFPPLLSLCDVTQLLKDCDVFAITFHETTPRFYREKFAFIDMDNISSSNHPPHPPPSPWFRKTTLSTEKRRTVMSLLAGHKSRKSTQQHGEGKKEIKCLHQSSSSDEIKWIEEEGGVWERGQKWRKNDGERGRWTERSGDRKAAWVPSNNQLFSLYTLSRRGRIGEREENSSAPSTKQQIDSSYERQNRQSRALGEV